MYYFSAKLRLYSEKSKLLGKFLAVRKISSQVIAGLAAMVIGLDCLDECHDGITVFLT